MASLGGLADIAEIIAFFRLNLDHVGTHIGQRLCTIRAENDRAHIGDFDIAQQIGSGQSGPPIWWLLRLPNGSRQC